MTAPIGKVLDEGNCGRATDRGEEACECVRKYRPDFAAGHILVKAARLRTETSYKAGSGRRVSTTSRSRSQTPAQVNGELAQRSITLLSGETCPAPRGKACLKARNGLAQAGPGGAGVSSGTGHLSMRMAGTHAMRVFGKPDRSSNCDCERTNEPTLLQAIFAQNDPLVRLRIADSGWLIEIEDAEAAGKRLDRADLINQVWLRTVGRNASLEERQTALKHLASASSDAEGIADLMWAMLNSKEFLLNH